MDELAQAKENKELLLNEWHEEVLAHHKDKEVVDAKKIYDEALKKSRRKTSSKSLRSI